MVKQNAYKFIGDYSKHRVEIGFVPWQRVLKLYLISQGKLLFSLVIQKFPPINDPVTVPVSQSEFEIRVLVIFLWHLMIELLFLVVDEITTWNLAICTIWMSQSNNDTTVWVCIFKKLATTTFRVFFIFCILFLLTWAESSVELFWSPVVRPSVRLLTFHIFIFFSSGPTKIRHRASLGEGDSSFFKWRVTTFCNWFEIIMK